jgi:SAM-dependent methyltransferase
MLSPASDGASLVSIIGEIRCEGRWTKSDKARHAMNQEVPELFDPVKSALALARAARIGPERFLLDRIAEDFAERMDAVLRDFSAPLDIGTPLSAFAERLAGHARIAGPVRRVREQIGGEAQPLTMPDLGLEPAAHDLIASGMLFHRVNDLPGLMIQLRRALKPDGLMMAAFPGGDTLHELRDVLVTAESEIRGAAGLRVFPMIDVRAAGQLLQRAGFALPVADSEKLTVRYPDLFALIRDLRAMGATALPLNRSGQPALSRAIILRAAELYATRHADPDGKIRATFEIVWISGWAPHASQQQPLKPGSAKARLADALRDIAGKKES